MHVGEIQEVRWFRKSFLKYRTENYTKNKNIFPFLTLMAVGQELERNKCSVTKCDWKLNPVYIILIYIHPQMHFILKYQLANCK